MGNSRAFARRMSRMDINGPFGPANPYRGFWTVLRRERRREQERRIAAKKMEGSNPSNG